MGRLGAPASGPEDPGAGGKSTTEGEQLTAQFSRLRGSNRPTAARHSCHPPSGRESSGEAGPAPRGRAAAGPPAYLCSGGRSCASLAGSGVLGMTPKMVLCSDVPLSSRLRTSCRLRAESTLVRMVEPGSNTPSCVSSSGRRLGIWMGLTDDIATALGAGGVPGSPRPGFARPPPRRARRAAASGPALPLTRPQPPAPYTREEKRTPPAEDPRLPALCFLWSFIHS